MAAKRKIEVKDVTKEKQTTTTTTTSTTTNQPDVAPQTPAEDYASKRKQATANALKKEFRLTDTGKDVDTREGNLPDCCKFINPHIRTDRTNDAWYMKEPLTEEEITDLLKNTMLKDIGNPTYIKPRTEEITSYLKNRGIKVEPERLNSILEKLGVNEPVYEVEMEDTDEQEEPDYVKKLEQMNNDLRIEIDMLEQQKLFLNNESNDLMGELTKTEAKLHDAEERLSKAYAKQQEDAIVIEHLKTVNEELRTENSKLSGELNVKVYGFDDEAVCSTGYKELYDTLAADYQHLADQFNQLRDSLSQQDSRTHLSTYDTDNSHNYEHVNHPSHYNKYDVEVIEMMRRIWGEDAVKTWAKLNAFKYRMRLGEKPDTPIERDLEKERFCLDQAKEK